MSANPINRKDLFLYAAIALPTAFAGYPLYVMAPDFYATHYNLSLSLLGLFLLIIRLMDAVQDPVIGYVADRWQNKIFVLAACAGFLLCAAIYALFNMVAFTPTVWFFVCMIIATSAFSILSIILGTFATRWTNDKKDQTRLAGARESFGIMGLMIAVALPAVLTQFLAPDHVFLWYSGLLVLLMVIGVLCFSTLRLKKTTEIRKTNDSFLTGLMGLSSRMKRLYMAYGLSMLASSIPAVLVIFFIRDLLHAESFMGLFLFVYFSSGLLTIPLWKTLSARFGKYKVWGLSHILAVIGFIGAFFLGADDIIAYTLVCAVSGFAVGADFIMPSSILADEVHAEDKVHFSGTHYAILVFISKISLAIASCITFPLLDFIGFRPQTENTDSALLGLSIAYAIIPCALKLASAGLIYTHFIRSYSGELHENTQNHRNSGSSCHV